MNHAERMNACFRACAGMSDTILSDPEYSITAEIDSLDDQINGRLKAEAERDEMLAALTRAAKDFINQNGTKPEWWTENIRNLVIAKAEALHG